MNITYNTFITDKLRGQCFSMVDNDDGQSHINIESISVTAHYTDHNKGLTFLVGFVCLIPAREIGMCGLDLYVRRQNRKNGIGLGLAKIALAMMEGSDLKPSIVAIHPASVKILKELGLRESRYNIWTKSS